MKGVSFITNETRKKRYVQIDLGYLSKYNTKELHDLMDILLVAARKNESSIPWESVKAELIQTEEYSDEFKTELDRRYEEHKNDGKTISREEMDKLVKKSRQ